MSKIQSNVQHGATVRLAAADLTGLEGRFVVVDANGKFALAGANPTSPLYILLDGGTTGANVTAEPITSGKRYRVRGGLANFTLGSVVTSGANGLAALATPASDTVIKSIAGVVEEANNIATADTGDVLILAMPHLVQRSAAP